MLYLKNWLNKYFGFTKGEYNALLTLLVILLFVSVFPYFFSKIKLNSSTLNAEEQLAIEQLTLSQKENRAHRYTLKNQIEDEESKSIQLFTFDPNTIDLAQWQKLGLSAKQAQAIINYVHKGGKFYKPQDLQKMYTISPQKYQQLLPYINITSLTSRFNQPNYTEKATYAKKQPLIVEINTADTLQLDEIKGVGAAFARRIVRYRQKLGGFYKKEQLLEVYGIDSLKYNEIKGQITLDLNAISKININTAEFDDLKNNPYLKYKQINAIIQYRKQHGKYNNIEDLKKVLILTPQNIINLTPYLVF